VDTDVFPTGYTNTCIIVCLIIVRYFDIPYFDLTVLYMFNYNDVYQVCGLIKHNRHAYVLVYIYVQQ